MRGDGWMWALAWALLIAVAALFIMLMARIRLG